MLWKVIMFSDNILNRRRKRKKNMKKIIIGLVITAILGLILVSYIFEQETVLVGRYTVLYHKNMCDLDPESFPQDLDSLKNLPGLIRITWREQISSDMYQEYCYLPGRGVEKARIVRTTK
jgi:hypothetical protein